MSTHALRRLGLPVLALAMFVTGWLVAAPQASASVPEDAQQHADIYIESDEQFNPAHGVRRGIGTRKAPFVISGWKVNRIYIRDTSAHLIIKDNIITSSLVLNWNGAHVTLVDNQIGDLRVNQNIARTGAPTSGLFARNEIGVVGQLRHFDGVFAHNVVGPSTSPLTSLPFFADRAVNFDGFHGADFHNNTIYGYVDVRLHGHHHGSGYNAPSHYHATPPETEDGHGGHHGHDEESVDHSRRWHKVTVRDNAIYSAGPWALRYFDQAHSANDRTAASETNEALNLPHRHFTKVYFQNNKLVGSGLVVDIFNAEDELHQTIGKGAVSLTNNSIVLEYDSADPFRSYYGIEAYAARGLMMHIAGNTVKWANPPEGLDQTFSGNVGIRLNTFDAANIHITNNELTDFDYGIMATTFTEKVNWWVSGLKTKNVTTRIYYDDSVKNHPRKG
jgi:hypothetical protein